MVHSIELVSSELARRVEDAPLRNRFISPWLILHLLCVTVSLALLCVYGPAVNDASMETEPRFMILLYILDHMVPTALFIVPLLLVVRKYQMDEKEKQSLIERSKKQMKVANEQTETSKKMLNHKSSAIPNISITKPLNPTQPLLCFHPQLLIKKSRVLKSRIPSRWRTTCLPLWCLPRSASAFEVARRESLV